MAESLADLAGQPRRLRLAGKDYDVYPLRISDFGALQSWVDAQFPDPFRMVKAELDRAEKAGEPYDTGQQKFLMRVAAELASRPRHLIGGDPDADAMVRSLEGVMQFLWLSIRRGDPAFDEAAAKELAGRLTYAEIGAVFTATTLDQVVPGEPPKGPTPMDGVMSA